MAAEEGVASLQLEDKDPPAAPVVVEEPASSEPVQVPETKDESGAGKEQEKDPQPVVVVNEGAEVNNAPAPDVNGVAANEEEDGKKETPTSTTEGISTSESSKDVSKVSPRDIPHHENGTSELAKDKGKAPSNENLSKELVKEGSSYDMNKEGSKDLKKSSDQHTWVDGDKKDKKKQKWNIFNWIKKEIHPGHKGDTSKEKSNDEASKEKSHNDKPLSHDPHDTKEKDPEQPEEARERKVIVVSTIEDFPEDCQKLIKQSEIPREKLEANFKILMNVLHFRTGKIFKTPETVNDPPRPVLPRSARLKRGEELLTDAVEFKKLYKDMEELGKGGFGSVFQARSTKDKKKLVAIKKMAHKTKKQKSANFHEAAILNFCNHPNIVKYLTCHEIKDELWVVMELMEGGTFEDAAKAWRFNEANIAYIARELLKGIAYMHTNQLAHRDLKSANIMMSVRAEVKMIDVGLCADMSVGFPTHMVGSPFWMPPEMIQCKPHNYAVDIWSFAISLLEIANQRPLMIESAVKAMFTVGTEGVKEMFLEPDKWSDVFKDFLGMCLKMDPEERATAADLLSHPFIKKADSRSNMENILRRIFLSNSLINSGF